MFYISRRTTSSNNKTEESLYDISRRPEVDDITKGFGHVNLTF